jgi:protein TonB
VKRLLPYVILALAFHAIILSTDFSWLQLAPSLTPAAKSLSITLSADMPQNHKAQAAAPQKAPERQSAQLQKPLPAKPPENIVKKARQKKSLKALTLKKQRIKTIETTRAANDPIRHIPPKTETKVFSTASSLNKPVHNPLAADAAFIKKTHRVPAGSSEPTTTAAMLPGTQSDDTLSGAVLKLARPLYKHNPTPPYPRKARRLGYEGIVMLKVLIDENGRVDDLTVLKSSGHSVLDHAALSAVRKWLFEPGSEGGIKKRMWVKIPVRFDLK